jgi:hypothetical protein
VLADVVAVMSLKVVSAALAIMLERMERPADVVLDAPEIVESKVCSSHTETSHQLVEERTSEVSNFLQAVKDSFGAINKRARLLPEPRT